MPLPIARRPGEEQILAILRQRTFAWACDQLPDGVSIDDVNFADLVSVSREDVERWVEEHGYGSTAVREGGGDGSEGLYVTSEGDGWVVFFLERGRRTFEHRFADRGEARRWVVDDLYDSARTALNHRWWHAHPDERPASIRAMP